MSKRLYPHNRVRYWRAYSIDEVCALFSDKGLHAQTVRKWLKNGLKCIDAGKPVLIYGNDLIVFLKQRNTQNKCKTEFHQLFCMKCQDARSAYKNQISVEQKAQFLKVNAVCRTCKKSMFKNYKLADFSALKKKFKLVDVSRLDDLTEPSDKTHLPAQGQKLGNESSQGGLFS